MNEQMQWDRVVLDEGHVIRNVKTSLCKVVCELKADKAWVLTGTPIQNKEFDLYPILKFLKFSPFDQMAVWKRMVDVTDDSHKNLATVVKTIMLRRTTSDLFETGELNCLTKKTVTIIEVILDDEEEREYKKLMNLFKNSLAGAVPSKLMRELNRYNERFRQYIFSNRNAISM